MDAEKALSQQNAALPSWWLDRMVTSRRPFVEKLTLVLARPLRYRRVDGTQRPPDARAEPDAPQARRRPLRRPGAGVVVDPAMLVWLNGNDNRVGAPNENLARELMELFTLGVGHYSETDVREAARALTGWTVDKPSITAKLDPKRHDPKPRRCWARRCPTPRPWSQCSSLVRSRRGSWWSRVVPIRLPDPPPPDVLARLVAVYGANRDIGALMRAVADEPAFLDPKNVLVKQPVEWAVGLMRALAVRRRRFRRRTPTGCAGRCGRSGRCRSTRQVSAAGPPARCG